MLTLIFACKQNIFTLYFCFAFNSNIQISSSNPPPSLFQSKVFWPTRKPTGEVSHDSQDADTKTSHLIYLESVYMCQSHFVSSPSTYLYTLRSPCCAHRWYWHMAATFAVLQILALLLRCLFLLPSGLHSALCKCHSSPVVLLGAANLEFDQLCCQWNITQIQHNNKSLPHRVFCCGNTTFYSSFYNKNIWINQLNNAMNVQDVILLSALSSDVWGSIILGQMYNNSLFWTELLSYLMYCRYLLWEMSFIFLFESFCIYSNVDIIHSRYIYSY